MVSSIFSVAVGAVLLMAPCGSSSSGVGDSPSTSEARAELLDYIGDVTSASGYRYAAVDDRGHGMGGAKIIQDTETGEFAAIYHRVNEPQQRFFASVATSTNLLDWTWQVDLSDDASQPTITAATDGGYVVAWEVGVTDDIHVRLNYFPSWDDLLAGTATKVFDAERQLPRCAEGTPNLYAASSTQVDFGLHFFAECGSDRQARGTSDWTSWKAVEEPLLDRAVLLQGYRGSVGDRDAIDFKGHEFILLEGQFTQGDWGSFRVFLYDEETGAADRASYPALSTEPSSVHVFIRTHGGSYSFSNMTVSQVEIDGRQALVVGIYIQRGAQGEEGQLIFYRIIEESDGD